MKGCMGDSFKNKTGKNRIVFEIRHYYVKFENIPFRWYSREMRWSDYLSRCMIYPYWYSKVGSVYF